MVDVANGQATKIIVPSELQSLVTAGTVLKETFNKEVDIIEKSEIDQGSRIEKEIEKTGVVVYEKQR